MAHAHLNDIGVTLRQQDCYHQAIDIFRDEVQAVKTNFQDKRATSSKAFHETTCMLQKANNHLSSLEPLPFAPSIKCYSVFIRDLITVHEIDSVLELAEHNRGPEQALIANSACQHTLFR
jgi:hypothetical protein